MKRKTKRFIGWALGIFAIVLTFVGYTGIMEFFKLTDLSPIGKIFIGIGGALLIGYFASNFLKIKLGRKR